MKVVKSFMAGVVMCAMVPFVLSSCAMTNGAPVSGVLYTGAKAPVTATPIGKPATKMGQACATSILGIVGTGDASIEAAKKAGGVARVISVDSDHFSVLGVYAKYCTIVRGQ